MKIRITLTMIALFIAALNSGYVGAVPLPLPGDPVPGIDVSIERSPSGIVVARKTTDKDGKFDFGALSPGKYKIKVSRLSEEARPVGRRSMNRYNPAIVKTNGIRKGTRNEQWTLRIEVNPHETVSGTNPGRLIKIGPKGGTIKGVVTMLESKHRRGRGVATAGRGGAFSTIEGVKGEADQATAIAGVGVSLEQNGVIIAQTSTNSSGQATFSNVAPGKYDLKTTVPSGRASNNYNSAKSNTAGIAGATIDSGSLTFSPTKPGVARITVIGPSAKTITVTITETGQTAKPTTTIRN